MSERPVIAAPAWKQALDNVSTVLVIAVSIGLLWRLFGGALPGATAAPAPRSPRPPAAALPSEPLSLDGAILKGSSTSKVAIVAFIDFQCPYCAQFAREVFPDLERTYLESGRVLFALRHLPLESIHPNALGAAVGAECAGEQGKFWQMHDRLFLDPKSLDPASVKRQAVAVGLNVDAFETCVSGPVAFKVKADASIAGQLQVNGTPTFFVGVVGPDGRVTVRHRLVGASSLAEFAKLVDPLLNPSGL